MLQIEALNATLAGRTILREVTLTARAGQVLAICGPNGAGKSTLLRACLAEIQASGRISLNGMDPRKTPPARMARLRAVLPQDTPVAFAFTTREIVGMGLEAGDFAGQPEVVNLALSATGLMALADRPIHSLSGGERQRAHLARALAQVWQQVGPDGPRWLFLDEPVASLDLGQQLAVLTLARRHADAGGGVVMVMHDLNLSCMFADRMLFLIDGSVAAEGTPHQVMQPRLLEQAYGCQVALNRLPATGPWLLPQCCAAPGA